MLQGVRVSALPLSNSDRSKFKKCVSECKRAALTIKTGTGIKKFQEGKNFGAWLNKLYDIVKTRYSC